jgi:PBP1b-binding outer membrane lipoprotein LpoB
MRSVLSIFIATMLVVVAIGCADTGARRIDQTERITTVHQIDIQDWEETAAEMLNSLLARHSLRGDGDQPAIIAVSLIENRTAERINIEHLTDYILTELNRSGRAYASLVEGIGGPEDPMIAEQRQAERFLEGRDAPLREYHYTLSGRIIEERRAAGRDRQSTFVFTLRLGDPRTGVAVWQEQKTIDKAGRRPAVGM